MGLYFTYFSVFICVLIFSDYLIRRLRDLRETKNYVNYRINLIGENADRKVVYERMLRERGVKYDSANLRISRVRGFIGQSGLRFDGIRTVSYVLALFLTSFIVFVLLKFNTIISLFLSLAITIFFFCTLIIRARHLRIRNFVTQLPDALDVCVRSLAAGHPISASVSLVAREMPDPIGSEFGLMSDEMTYGVDIDTATRNMFTRVGAEELNLLAISLTVQRGAGGNLSEILENLSDMLRRRFMMRAKIKALSAEGRMTSWVMLLFPFFLYAMIKTISPDYFEPIWESGYGYIFIGVGISLMTVGMLILRKIVNFDF